MAIYSFYEDVYEIVRQIPRGRVTSYGAIANFLGTGGSARMVGWAMNQAHGKDVPAHRVVNSKGILTGKFHFGSDNQMKKLLENEGIEIQSDQILSFQGIFWDPVSEIGL